MSRRLWAAVTLLSAGCTTTTGLVTTPVSKTWVEDFSVRERRVFEETLGALASLRAGALAIPETDYAAASRFRTVFGFSLDGERLARWWARRIRRAERGDAWTVAVYGGDHTIVVREDFFDLPLLDRLYVLLHEARHADGDGYRHVDCPPRQPASCDDRPDGAYTFQAAFLYELYAYGLVDAEGARTAWLATRARIVTGRRAPRSSVR